MRDSSIKSQLFLNSFVAVLLILLIASCGSGGDSGGSANSTGTNQQNDTNQQTGTNQLTDTQRIDAATATAQSDSNSCASIRPFYWEIGNKTAALASGSVNDASASTQYNADSLMSIASASKWLYSAYVVQLKNAVLTADDIKYLTFLSGYTNFSFCLPGQTVDSCLSYLNNGVYDSANDGKFFYNGGHMQKHASLLGLGSLDNAGLAAEVQSQLGADIALDYTQPQLAGGVETTPANYARFLRKVLNGDLKIGNILGSNAVCTNPTRCPADVAVSTPIPETEIWHYSIGHWVEDDPAVGDGAFSSPGLFGFYPWVDADRNYYGIVARKVLNGYYESVQCGRLIRKAWINGKTY